MLSVVDGSSQSELSVPIIDFLSSGKINKVVFFFLGVATRRRSPLYSANQIRLPFFSFSVFTNLPKTGEFWHTIRFLSPPSPGIWHMT